MDLILINTPDKKSDATVPLMKKVLRVFFAKTSQKFNFIPGQIMRVIKLRLKSRNIVFIHLQTI